MLGRWQCSSASSGLQLFKILHWVFTQARCAILSKTAMSTALLKKKKKNICQIFYTDYLDIDYGQFYCFWKYRQLIYARITGFKNSPYLPTTIRKLPHRKLCPSRRQKQGFWEIPFQESMTVTGLTCYPFTLLTLCAAAGPSFPQQRTRNVPALRSRAVLWPLCSTKRKQELAQPWPCLGCRLLWSPSKSRAEAPLQKP